MKLLRPKPFTYFLTLFIFFQASAQKLESTLQTLHREFAPERISVHFDKSVYSPGETIWFKAYLTSGVLPSAISTNFYTELLDKNGKILQKKLIPVYLSSAAGSFDIPPDWKDDQLIFRAYTSWMLNFDSAFLYTRNIWTNNPGNNSTLARNTQLRFFPEGGDLVEGMGSLLAFKASDQFGFPVNVSGEIKTSSGRAVASFNSQHDGMGSINFTPAPNTSYYAEWKDGQQLKRTELPSAKRSGIVLHVEEDPENIRISVNTSGDESSLQSLMVLAQMHDQVVFRAKMNKQKTLGKIPKNALISGILQVTVFDANWKPLAERIIFIDRKDYEAAAHVNWVQKGFNKRNKNVFEVEVPDTLFTNLSISITDALLESKPQQSNIVTDLLLTSDLRGYIHQPYYYFSNDSDSTKAHLDLLMLTNGWRRYNWEQLAKGELPGITYPKENYLTLTGKVLGVRPEQIPRNTQLNIILEKKDSSRQFINTTIDAKGNFSIPRLVFFDTASLYYQFNGKSYLNDRATISFDKRLYPEIPSLGLDPSFISRARTIALTERDQFFASKTEEILPRLEQKAKGMEEIIIRTKARSRQEEIERKYVSGLFQSGNSRSFLMGDDPSMASYLNILDYLQGRVPGLQIFNTDDGYEITRRSSVPSLYVNEFLVDVQHLTNIPVTDIVYVKVIDPPFVGADGNGSGGAIAIYTKKGGDAFANNTRGLETGRAVGYAPMKEFYSPDYATPSPLHDVEDVRSTLYWNPFILTNKASRKIRLDFYNNDVSRSFKVIMEGMNEEGRLIRVEKIIQ